MSVSVFDHPVLLGLLGDEPVAAHFTAVAEIDVLVRFEAALAIAQEAAGVIPAGAATAIGERCAQFEPDMEALKQATRRDGVCVPELVRQLRDGLAQDVAEHLHFGATSQDVIDTGLVLRLRPVMEEYHQRLDTLIERIGDAESRFGNRQLMAHTRMQRAVPISVSDKLANWRKPLAVLKDSLGHVQTRVLRLQFGGAAGTLDRLGEKGPEVSSRLAAELDLADDGCWHTDRTAIAELAGWLARLTGVLGKIGQDTTLMAQNEVGQITLSGGGTSSAMAHKNNPVAAETLVALAGFNATLVSGMHNALVHENERSGSAWTLEWMLLPQMAVAAGAALGTANRLMGSIQNIGAAPQGGGTP